MDIKKARDDFSLSIYWHRQTPNKEINSPLPRLIGYRYPLVGEWIRDNYFDLLPGEERTIHVTTPLTHADFKRQLKVATLGDTYTAANAPSAPATTISGHSGGTVKPLGE